MTDRNEKRSAAEESLSGIRLYMLMFTMSYCKCKPVAVSRLCSVKQCDRMNFWTIMTDYDDACNLMNHQKAFN